MIVAQNNRLHKEQQPMPIPIQQPYPPYPPQPYQPPNCPHSNQTISESEVSIQQAPFSYPQSHPKKETKKKHKPNRHKKYNLYKLRKFRAAVIAVYFTLLFPKYCFAFTLKRYKLHCEESKKKNTALVSEFVDEMMNINLV